MKKAAIIIISLALSVCAFAQTPPDVYELEDTLSVRIIPDKDTTLVGKNIFSLVNVRQRGSILSGMMNWRSSNSSRAIKGYRISIFSESRQTARAESEAVVERFKSRFPEVGVYRFYANPEFRVYVGDFRDKSEVTRFLNLIIGEYPSAFVVETKINYPKVY